MTGKVYKSDQKNPCILFKHILVGQYFLYNVENLDSLYCKISFAGNARYSGSNCFAVDSGAILTLHGDEWVTMVKKITFNLEF